MDWKEFVIGIIEALAWPFVIVFVIAMLKDNAPSFLKKLAEKLKSAKYKDAELHFSTQEQQNTIDPVSAAKLDTLIPKETTSLHTDIKNLITSQLDEIESDEDKIKILVSNLAHAQAKSNFERIEYSIYGSQIRLLEYMNEKGNKSCSKEELFTFYEEACNNYPDTYHSYSFDMYLGYLESNELIFHENEEWILKNDGRDFLIYLAQPGKSKAKRN